MTPEIVEGDDVQRVLVRGFEINLRSHSGFKGFLPAVNAKAPFIAVLHSREIEFRPGC